MFKTTSSPLPSPSEMDVFPSPVSSYATPARLLPWDQYFSHLPPVNLVRSSISEGVSLPSIHHLLSPSITPPCQMSLGRADTAGPSMGSDLPARRRRSMFSLNDDDVPRRRSGFSHGTQNLSPEMEQQILEHMNRRSLSDSLNSLMPTYDEYALVLQVAEECRRGDRAPRRRSFRVTRNPSSLQPATSSRTNRPQRRRLPAGPSAATTSVNRRTARPLSPSENTKSARAKSTKAISTETYQDIQMYVPNIGSMQNPRDAVEAVLKLITKPTAMWSDMSNDPERSLLSEAEITLCRVLNLTGCKYLLARGQIVRGYVNNQLDADEKKRKPVENWNKTAAQKVCNIDVNKASHLFAFFTKVGWFERHHYPTHLPPKAEQASTSTRA